MARRKRLQIRIRRECNDRLMRAPGRVMLPLEPTVGLSARLLPSGLRYTRERKYYAPMSSYSVPIGFVEQNC